jgi:signal transduction histidine kinase
MAWYSTIMRKLYLRIWLAVVSSVLVYGLIMMGAWYFFEKQARLLEPSIQQIEVHDSRGDPIYSTTEPMRRLSDGGLEFRINAGTDNNGENLPFIIQLKPRAGSDSDPWRRWDWLRPRYAFWSIVVLTGFIEMAFMFPFVRRLTRRLETLRQGVLRYEQNDLSIRFSDFGDDEIADLSRHFNAAADHVATLLESQKALLTHVSHELRSPLARIRLALDLALHSDAANQRARAEILHSLDELDEIIEKILLTSRMEIRPGLYDAEPVGLIGLLAEECARADATLNIAPEVAANPASSVVQGSLLLLRRAVRNLLENAAKHGKCSDGTSQTSVLFEFDDTQEQAILIHVDDCGRGVPIDQRKYIFEPFYTVPGPHNRGFGLGLALVRMIVERHGGSVVYSDCQSGGARFTLRLPCQVASPSATA